MPAYSTEQTRLSETKWLTAFRHYLSLLESGKLQQQDAQAGLIFPNRYKQANQKVAEQRVCIECGKVFDIMESERDYFLLKGMALPRRCPICRDMRKKLKSMDGSGASLSGDASDAELPMAAGMSQPQATSQAGRRGGLFDLSSLLKAVGKH